MVDSKKHFIDSIQFAFIVTMITTGIATLAGWMTAVNPWELAATFTSYSCTYMCVKQTRWNYPMAILSTSLLAYVFYTSNLLASAVLNLYLIPTVIYGYFIWGKDAAPRPVEWVKKSKLLIYGMVTLLTYGGAYAIVTKLGGSFAPLDSFLLIGSIFAQFLLDRKKINTWFVWIAVNVISVYVYFNSGLYLLSMQFAVFLGTAVMGFFNWKATMKEASV